MNKYNPEIHHRRSIRLKGYDYSQAGLYFITICCQDMSCMFGSIISTTAHINTESKLNNSPLVNNDAGQMIKQEYLGMTTRFQNFILHDYVVMPNHFHCIIQIINETPIPKHEEQQNEDAHHQNKTVGDWVDAFKSITTVEYIRGVKTMGWQRFNGKLWQRNYYEHIIKNNDSYQYIADYINNNPYRWKDDTFYKEHDT